MEKKIIQVLHLVFTHCLVNVKTMSQIVQSSWSETKYLKNRGIYQALNGCQQNRFALTNVTLLTCKEISRHFLSHAIHHPEGTSDESNTCEGLRTSLMSFPSLIQTN